MNTQSIVPIRANKTEYLKQLLLETNLSMAEESFIGFVIWSWENGIELHHQYDRDALRDFIKRHEYDWTGHYNECPKPTG